MDIRCYDEGRLQIRRVGIVRRNDAAAPLSLDFTILALLALTTLRHSSLVATFLGQAAGSVSARKVEEQHREATCRCSS